MRVESYNGMRIDFVSVDTVSIDNNSTNANMELIVEAYSLRE